MIRKLVGAMFVMTVAIGFAFADEFTATITKVDGNKITYQKKKKGKDDGDPVTIEVAKDAKIAKGKKGAEKGKFDAGDAIEGGLKSEIFTKSEKGVNARITTSDDNKSVTQILVIQGKKAAQ